MPCAVQQGKWYRAGGSAEKLDEVLLVIFTYYMHFVFFLKVKSKEIIYCFTVRVNLKINLDKNLNFKSSNERDLIQSHVLSY